MTAVLAPSPGATSPATPALALSSVGLPVLSDATMAWWLAEAAGEVLVGHERTMTFVELGCGEYFLAIVRIINAASSRSTTLPVVIFDRLDGWLDGYVGSPEEPHLRARLARIRQRQFQPFHAHADQVKGSAGLRLARCRAAY